MLLRPISAAVCVSVALLAGCASGPTSVVSDVQSYSNMQGIALPATYRMELLPSQQQQSDFTRIEAAAENALAKVGLQRAPQPERAALVVQVGATANQGWAQHPTYWDPYFYGPRFGWGLGYGWYPGWSMHWMMDTPPRVYVRAVKLVLRDRKSQRIVYETSAKYDEVRVDDSRIWQTLFDAALTGFPFPPAGPRQVRSTGGDAPASTAPAPAAAQPGVPAPAAEPAATSTPVSTQPVRPPAVSTTPVQPPQQ